KNRRGIGRGPPSSSNRRQDSDEPPVWKGRLSHLIRGRSPASSVREKRSPARTRFSIVQIARYRRLHRRRGNAVSHENGRVDCACAPAAIFVQVFDVS